MPITSLKKYPVDVTGVHPDNRIANELWDISPNNRVIVPRQGYFYGESVVIVRADQVPLKLGKDFRLEDMNEELTKLTGKAVMSTIVLIDNTILGEVAVTYQCYGTSDNYSRTYIADLVDQATNNGVVDWSHIENKPSAFRPSPHRHPLQETYGWKATVKFLNDLVQIISHWRFDRDSNVYATISQYQQDIIRRIEGMNRTMNEARQLIGSIDNLTDFVNGEIDRMREQFKSVSSSDEITNALRNLESRLTDAYIKADAASKQAITADMDEKDESIKTAYQNADNALSTRIDGLIQDNTADHTTIRNEIQSAKTAVENKVTEATTRLDNAKADKTELIAKLAELKASVDWVNLPNKPEVLSISKLTSTSFSDYNQYTTKGIFTFTNTTKPARNAPPMNGEGVLTVNQIADTQGDVTQSLHLVDGNYLYTRSRRNGTWSDWTQLPSSVSTLDTTKSLSTIPLYANGNFGLATTADLAYWEEHGGLTAKTALDGVVMQGANSGQTTQLISLGKGHLYHRLQDNRDVNTWEIERILTTGSFDLLYPGLLATPNKVTALENRLTAALASMGSNQAILDLTNKFSQYPTKSELDTAKQAAINHANAKFTEVKNSIDSAVTTKLNPLVTRVTALETKFNNYPTTTVMNNRISGVSTDLTNRINQVNTSLTNNINAVKNSLGNYVRLSGDENVAGVKWFNGGLHSKQNGDVNASKSVVIKYDGTGAFFQAHGSPTNIHMRLYTEGRTSFYGCSQILMQANTDASRAAYFTPDYYCMRNQHGEVYLKNTDWGFQVTKLNSDKYFEVCFKHDYIFTNCKNLYLGGGGDDKKIWQANEGGRNVIAFQNIAMSDFYMRSDRRVKSNIKTIENGLDIVKQINPVTFNLTELQDKPSAGVIAQELEAILPDFVSENNEGLKSVNYLPLIAYLVSAVKTLSSEVDELKAKLNEKPQE